MLLKSQHQPVTPKDMNIPTEYQGITTELIYDGIIVDSNLDQVHLDRKWLKKELRKKGIHDPSEVFLATLDTSGNLYVDTYKDHVTSPVDISDPIKPQKK